MQSINKNRQGETKIIPTRLDIKRHNKCISLELTNAILEFILEFAAFIFIIVTLFTDSNNSNFIEKVLIIVVEFLYILLFMMRLWLTRYSLSDLENKINEYDISANDEDL